MTLRMFTVSVVEDCADSAPDDVRADAIGYLFVHAWVDSAE